jgi:hypothetical protein
MSEDIQKNVDDTWKDQVSKEKKAADEKKEPYHEPTFPIFVYSLTMQAMIAMGKLENPMTNKSESNFEQARFLIDTLGIIQEKTKGNLNEDEDKMLAETLANLRMLYVQSNTQEKPTRIT